MGHTLDVSSFVAQNTDLLFHFIPAIFSHTVQIHGAFKRLIREQIHQRVISFEGEAKQSKIKSTMKW